MVEVVVSTTHQLGWRGNQVAAANANDRRHPCVIPLDVAWIIVVVVVRCHPMVAAAVGDVVLHHPHPHNRIVEDHHRTTTTVEDHPLLLIITTLTIAGVVVIHTIVGVVIFTIHVVPPTITTNQELCFTAGRKSAIGWRIVVGNV